MRTGFRLAFLLVWSRLGVVGPGYEPPGASVWKPASTAPCEKGHGQCPLENAKYYRYWCSTCGDFWYCNKCNLYLAQSVARSHRH